MKRLVLRLVVAPLLWFSVAAAAETPMPQPGFHWSQFPTAPQMNAVFPRIAAENEFEGEATLNCAIVNVDGHVSCTLVSEIPEMCGNQLDFDHPTRTLLGRITGYPVIKDASGNPVQARCEFGKAAITAVERWGRADMTGGVAVGTTTRLTVRFQLG
jgi:hypothetical protein